MTKDDFMAFFRDEESLNNIIKSIIREHHFPPQVIDALFVDDQDYHGLEWWYNDVRQAGEEFEAKLKKKK